MHSNVMLHFTSVILKILSPDVVVTVERIEDIESMNNTEKNT